MATIRNSELTAEQWEEMTGKIQEELKSMSFSDYTKLYETDILKDRGDYIHTQPRITGKSTAMEAAQKMKELDRSFFKSGSSMTEFTKAMTSAAITTGTSTINTTGFTKENKDGDVLFGPDGMEIYQDGEWKPLLGKSGIDSDKIRGRSASITIFDDNINEDQIVSDNTDVLASIKKADQLDIHRLNTSDRTLDFTGGMVAMYIKDKGFRRKAAKPCKMTISEFYDGKKKGVICKLVTDDHHTGGLPADLQHIEIPVTELASYFRESDVLKVLGEMTVYGEGTTSTRATNLYSEESISGLPDFGAF